LRGKFTIIYRDEHLAHIFTTLLRLLRRSRILIPMAYAVEIRSLHLVQLL